MLDRSGQQLANYRLLHRLGSGGFAEVYLGEHLYLGSRAAIKLLFAHIAPESMTDFQEEARRIKSLAHPHIVQVLDFGVQGNTPYLVMDYAPGGTLRLRHPRGTRLPLSIVVTYVKHVAQALQYAHDHKLIHRDVKPENMLLGPNGEIWLSDFGIAIIASTSKPQISHDVAGTMMYMAPEQITGSPVYASDQYALGIIVYEWLAGTPPFQGSPQELIAKHLHIPPPPLHQKGVMLPPGVERVVMRTLEKDPAQRFASMQEFALALTNGGQVTPQQAMPSSTSSRVALPQSVLISPPSPSAQVTDYPDITSSPAVTHRLTPTFSPTQRASTYYPTVPAIVPRVGNKRQPKKKLWIILAIFLVISIITYGFWLPALSRVKLPTLPSLAQKATPTDPVTENQAYAVMDNFCFYLPVHSSHFEQGAYNQMSHRYRDQYSEPAFTNMIYAKTGECTYDSPSISNGLRVIALNVDTGRYRVTIIYDPGSDYHPMIDDIQPFA
jgi:serine/threonine protein kinase